MLQQQLEQARDNLTQAHTIAEGIRSKYAGKTKDMPGDERESWERALADGDAYADEIKKLERELSMKEILDHATDNSISVRTREEVVDNEGNYFTAQELKTQRSIINRIMLDGMGTVAFLSNDERAIYDRSIQKRDATLANPTNMGYLQLPQQMVTTLIKSIDNLTYIRGKATKFSVPQAMSLGAPTLDTDVDDADWTGENTQVTFGDVALGKRELYPHYLSKGVKISEPLIRKAVTDPAALVLQRLAYKFAVTEEKAFLTGDGNRKPLGMLKIPTDGSGISANQDITTTNSGLLNEPDDIMKVPTYLKQGYLPNCSWLLSRDALIDVRLMKDNVGHYVWQPFDFPGKQLTGYNPGMIAGFPYSVSEYMTMKTAGSWVAGDYAMLFGDYSYFWIADSLNMTVQMLTELFAQTNFMGWIARKETDGMPVLSEAFIRVKIKS